MTIARFDEPTAIRPRYHIWTASRVAWCETADELPRYPERCPGAAS